MTKGGRGVKKSEVWGDVIYGWSLTRKCPLRGYSLAPLEGRGDRIPWWAELRVTEGQTDVEFEIVF